jgi:hypothetical protein
MLLHKLKLASAALLGAGLIAWAASAALASWGDDPPKAAPAPGARRAVPSPPDSEPGSLDTVGTFPVAGRVLDPDDKPVAGAEVYIWHSHEGYPETGHSSVGDPVFIKCFIGLRFATRPNVRLDTGEVFRNVVLERLGEVRELGEVKVKGAAE